MAFHPLLPCLCGSRKQYLRCCMPIHAEVEPAFRQQAQGQHGAALRTMDEVCARHPDNPEVWCQKARLLFEQGRSDDAENALQKALDLNPHHRIAHFLRGCFRQGEGEFPDALLVYSKAVGLYDPTAKGSTVGQVLEEAPRNEDKPAEKAPLVSTSSANLGEARRNEDRPATPRRRLPLRVALLVLLGVLLAWRLWQRPAPVAEPPGPTWPSPLDVLDPARLADKSWPRDARPAEAVGVLNLDRDADDRLEVSIAEGIILIKDARGKEMVRIDGYASFEESWVIGPWEAGRWQVIAKQALVLKSLAAQGLVSPGVVSSGVPQATVALGVAAFDTGRLMYIVERTHRIAQVIALQGLVSPGAAPPDVLQVAVALGVKADALALRKVKRDKNVGMPWDMNVGNPRDDHGLFGAALSPKADRLIVLGRTRHIAGMMSRLSGHDADWSGAWAQVWRWEGNTLTPLEVQLLDNRDARVAAFSPDSKLLATGSDDRTDLWEVGDKGLTHLRHIAGKSKQLLFAPDGRSLAVLNPGSVGVYDLRPLLPGDSGWAWVRWQLLCVVLGLLAAVAVSVLVSQPSEAARSQRRLSLAVRAAFLGVGACVAWWALWPVPAGLPLSVGLGFGAALGVLLLLAWARESARESLTQAGDQDGSAVTARIRLVAIVGAVVCLGLWAWQNWWPAARRLAPSGSDLARADLRAACFSADGSKLAAVRGDGRLSLFDVATGKERHGWKMPAGVLRPEYAADGRHLLAVAEGKAYVLRLKPLDDAASVLLCCDKVLAQNPRAVHALLARGHVHLHRGELDSAIADFTAVIAQDAKHAAAYYGRGLARTDRGDYAGARADFAAALRHDPKLAAAVSGGRPRD
jgi:tetratricopeptide (TPR) repeat protein